MKIKCAATLFCLLTTFFWTGCHNSRLTPDTGTPDAESTTQNSQGNTPDNMLTDTKENRLELDDWHYAFSGDKNALYVHDQTITIKKEGIYRISGTLLDGKIVVDTAPEGVVRLILDGTNINSRNGEALQVKSAACVMIETTPDSVNSLVDLSEPKEQEEEKGETDTETAKNKIISACLYADCNLIFEGSGTLHIRSKQAYAMTCTKDFYLRGSTITMTAVHSGLFSGGLVEITGGKLNITEAEYGLIVLSSLPGAGCVRVTNGALAACCRKTAILYANALFLNPEVTSFSCRKVSEKTTWERFSAPMDSSVHLLS